jgi:hypothetical protein
MADHRVNGRPAGIDHGSIVVRTQLIGADGCLGREARLRSIIRGTRPNAGDFRNYLAHLPGGVLQLQIFRSILDQHGDAMACHGHHRSLHLPCAGSKLPSMTPPGAAALPHNQVHFTFG